MEKKLIDYLPYYIGQKVRVFDSELPGKDYVCNLSPELIALQYHYKNRLIVQLYLKPTAEITRKDARLFIEFTPDDFGDTVHWYVKRGYDVFGLIKAGLAKHKNTLYE